MKQLKIFIYFLKLIRWLNLLIVIATMFLMRYCIIRPLLYYNNLELQLSLAHFLMLVAATTLITAAGYIINDYFDRKTDLINKPYRVIVGRFIKRRAAMIFHMVFNGIGLLLGVYISYKNDLNFMVSVFILASGILWFYSTHYKRQVLVGNIIVALLTAIVPMLVILFELPLLNIKYKTLLIASNMNLKFVFTWVSGFAYFAFVTTLIREIVKDVEDLEGDHAYGRNSLPMVIGVKSTKLAIVILFLAVIFSIIMALIFYIPDIYSISYLSTLIVFPSLACIYLTIMAKNKNHYARVSAILKFIMVFGVMYSVLVEYIIKNIHA